MPIREQVQHINDLRDTLMCKKQSIAEKVARVKELGRDPKANKAVLNAATQDLLDATRNLEEDTRKLDVLTENLDKAIHKRPENDEKNAGEAHVKTSSNNLLSKFLVGALFGSWAVLVAKQLS